MSEVRNLYGKLVRHAQGHTNHKRVFDDLADLAKFNFARLLLSLSTGCSIASPRSTKEGLEI